MAYIPPRKMDSADMQAISRSFGIALPKILDTVKRVERKRCHECGSLSCAHIVIVSGQ